MSLHDEALATLKRHLIGKRIAGKEHGDQGTIRDVYIQGNGVVYTVLWDNCICGSCDGMEGILNQPSELDAYRLLKDEPVPSSQQ